MTTRAAQERRRKLRSGPAAYREDEALMGKLIRQSMNRWQSMDAAGRLLGRGLGRKELIDRVAKEVGKSHHRVQSALKRRSP